MPIPRRAAVLTLLAAATAGCAGDGTYPSLGTRAVEARGWADPPPAPPAPVAADPALDARIAAAQAAMGAGADAFRQADARAGALVAAARGAPAGSERWVAAEAALADLDAAHARTGEAAGALEDLAAERAQALAADYPPLEAARAAAAAQVAAEAARIDSLGGRLPAG